MAGFPEGDIQLLDEDVTVPIIGDPNNGVAVLDFEEAWGTRLNLMVGERMDGRGSLGSHRDLSSAVDVPSPETCLEMKAPPGCGGLV
ncbi:hypothetical protein [Methylobacterium oxalidis]|uniref:hypothetical protein n=1 Tax=Methylobacterium oxalidis TaxID=944322 RepID=UPI0011BD8AA1|nr:hypothetical protein [Methylobacterium oxalidis]